MKIEFDDIHASLGGKEILKGVHLTAEDRMTTGIIGPNGCGKSTLLKTLFGIVPKTRGTIRLDHQDIAGYSKKKISSLVGYVGQDIPVVFDFSVHDIVEMALYSSSGKNRQQKEAIICKALEEMQISHLADRSILSLSGGERKMVFLARTIAQGCDTVILDEPTNHLDIKHQLYIMDYLKKSGKTILIVLHDLNLASHYCDRLYMLHQGENAVCGTPEEVLTQEWVRKIFQVSGEFQKEGSSQPGFFLDYESSAYCKGE